MKPSIEVVSIHTGGRPCVGLDWEVYIGRASHGMPGSPLGNPYPVAKYGREGAIAKFKVDLDACQGVKNECTRPAHEVFAMKLELERLYATVKTWGRIRIFCWCAPKACHGDLIKEVLEKWLMQAAKAQATDFHTNPDKQHCAFGCQPSEQCWGCSL